MITEQEQEQDTVNEKGQCSVEECGGVALCRGYCGKHYSRWHRTGSPTGSTAVMREKGASCALEGCERPAGPARGWCGPHYGRFLKYGDPEAGGPFRDQKRITVRGICRWPEGCKELERARGLCTAHYQRARYNADYEYLLDPEHRAERCILPDCGNPQYAKGFCHNHNEKARRGVDVLGEAEMSPVDYATFGGRLYALRASRGWTLAEVAEKAGVSRERIRQLEGQSTLPRAATLGTLATAFEVDVSVLIGDQLPPGIGTGRTRSVGRPPKKSRHIHLRCLWCDGGGELPLSSRNENTPQTTMCAYCQGSGAIYVSPAPTLSSESTS